MWRSRSTTSIGRAGGFVRPNKPDYSFFIEDREETHRSIARLLAKAAGETGVGAAADKAQAARPIEQFQKLQEKQRTMAMQAELTSSLIEKVPRSFLLAELTNSLPTGVSLAWSGQFEYLERATAHEHRLLAGGRLDQRAVDAGLAIAHERGVTGVARGSIDDPFGRSA